MESNFNRGSNVNRRVNFQHVRGSLYNDSNKKGQFSTLKSDSKLLKIDPGHISTVEM